MKKQITWLLNGIESWVREGIIDETRARAICGRYPAPEQAGAWDRIAFVVGGAVLIGLGVPLLLTEARSSARPTAG